MQTSKELNDVIMSLDELVAACGQDRNWVVALIEENIIDVDAGSPQSADNVQANSQTPYFTGYQLSRVRRAARLSRDFEASVPALGLILDLLDEVEQLRKVRRQWQTYTYPVQVIEVDWD